MNGSTVSRLLMVMACILVIAESVSAAGQIVYLTVGYCPTYTTGAGAVIAVDSETAEWKLVHKFDWPSEIFGCVADYDPTVTFTKDYIYFDFQDDFGYEITVDLTEGKISDKVKPKDPFFTGFTNMAYDSNSKKLLGAMPVGKDDGEFQWVELNPKNGDDKTGAFIPFRAMLDDSHSYDPATQTFWVQCSYDKRNVTCAPSRTDLCLLNIDSSNGDIRSAVYTNWTVYKYAPSISESGDVLAFVEGFDQVCKQPYGDFLFAKVNLPKAEATPIACLEKNITIQEEEWLSSFSTDEKLLATGSRFDGNTQFLVFDTTTGTAIVDSHLPGISDALGTVDKLFWIWSVDFDKK